MAPTTLLVYDSQDAVGARIIDILADWHASAWLGSYVTVSIVEIEARGDDVAHAIARRPAGPNSGEGLLSMLDMRDESEVRIAVLTVVGEDDHWIEQRRVAQSAADRLNSGLPNRIAAIEVVVPFIGGRWRDDLSAWPGWDVVVCAPEQTSSLEQPGLDLHCDLSSPSQVDELAAHSAAFVAASVGLWAGSSRSFFDHTDHTDEVRVGRAAHRRVDATALADAIRTLAFTEEILRSPSAELALSPGPLQERAENLKDLINLLARPKQRARPTQKVIGLWESIKIFVSFMFSAMLKAPAEVISGLSYRVKAGTANAMQSLIFGSDSEMVIAVGGVSAASGTDDLQAVQDGLANLDVALRRIPGVMIPETGSGATQRAFWQSCFDNAFALLTGARQGGADPCNQEGHDRFFPSSHIAPQVGRWRPEGQLVSGVPTDGVALYDTRAVSAARKALEFDARERSGWQGTADEHLALLKEAAAPWMASYLGRVGLVLSMELGKYEGVIAELLRRAQQPPDSGGEEAADVVRRMRRYTRLIASMAVGGIALSWVLRFLVPGFPALLLTLLAVVAWIIAFFLKYAKTKQELLKLQYRRDLADYELQQVLVELPVAVENARRLAKLYAQYRIWARLLSAFLDRPFGGDTQTVAQSQGLLGSIPKSVSSGVYVDGDQDDARHACARIADGLRYQVNRLWSDFVDIGYDSLVASRPQFTRVSTEDIFGQSDTQPESFLPQWAGSLLADGTEYPQVSDQVASAMDRRQMRRVLKTVDQEALGQMRRAYRVQQVGAGGRPAEDRPREETLRPALFSARFFSTFGINKDVRAAADVQVYASSIVETLPPRHWFDEVDTTIVLSPPTTFAALKLESSSPDWGDDPVPAPPPDIRGM